jgi:mannose-6-phosphate isomerase
MLYPLKFHPVYKNYLWGGHSLANWGKLLPSSGAIAESWEISGHPNGLSIIANGDLAGVNLPEAIRHLGRTLVGSWLPDHDLDRFPLLIKLIDARDRLSVQVHPNDDYARSHETGESGKSEMWYVVAAQPDASIIAGIRPGVSPREFAEALAAGRCLDLLQTLRVKAGDAVNIPAGLVHAIGAGVVIWEIQQSANTTYRLWDYGRKDSLGKQRPLQAEQALSAIDFSRQGPMPLLPGLIIRNRAQPGLVRRVLVLNRYFRVEELIATGISRFYAGGLRFQILTVLTGQGELEYADPTGSRQICLPLNPGDSLLIPASLGPWQISGQLKLLAAYAANFTADLQQLAEDTAMAGQPDRELIAAWSGLIGFDPLP